MKDKVVIITGGSSGIGKALAEQFGNRGSRVLITGRDASALHDTVAELKQKNIDVRALVAYVSKEDENRRMA